jgi:ABC-2 type transport system ATP-binding protein
VLVLDEPTNGLDPQGVRWLRVSIRQLADEGRTVLVSSHALSEVEQTADHVLLLAKGRLVRSSTLVALRAEAGVGCRVRTPDPERLITVLDAAGHRYHQVDEELAVDAAPEQVGELAAAHGIVLHRLTATAGLEEAFCWPASSATASACLLDPAVAGLHLLGCTAAAAALAIVVAPRRDVLSSAPQNAT